MLFRFASGLLGLSAALVTASFSASAADADRSLVDGLVAGSATFGLLGGVLASAATFRWLTRGRRTIMLGPGGFSFYQRPGGQELQFCVDLLTDWRRLSVDCWFRQQGIVYPLKLKNAGQHLLYRDRHCFTFTITKTLMPRPGESELVARVALTGGPSRTFRKKVDLVDD